MDGEFSTAILLDGDNSISETINADAVICVEVDGSAELEEEQDGEFDITDVIGGDLGVFFRVSDATAYGGETTVTPDGTTQVLNTIGRLMGDNITINPIPSNYGRITWNGAQLLVE